MSFDERVISVESLGKRYEIYTSPRDRLKQMVLPRLQGLVGAQRRSYFQEFWALRGISFDIRRGETVGIIGRNGSGKSTLLQLICGTLHPTEGAVRTNGRIAALLELGAGFNVEFTGEENVFLSGLLYGIPERVLKQRFQSILDFAEIGDFIRQPVKTYSSGMYVRLAFAIAAHVDADVLVVDEALSVGDVRFMQKCMRFLRDFQKRGTLLFVSHDAGAVTNLCHRAIWLDAGRIRADGQAREVVERYLAEQHAQDRASVGETVAVREIPLEGEVVRSAPAAAKTAGNDVSQDVVDVRKRIIDGADGLNRIEIFDFDEASVAMEYGAGRARICDVQLLDESGKPRQLTYGGEIADLVIDADVREPLDRPIFGFYVKDRLGQRLFGDNTYLSYRDEPIHAEPGSRLRARFRFRMPILPNGAYSVDVALASGTQDDHTQQHWIHDALTFRASESTMRSGLVGIPMHAIDIQVMETV